jgi:hypothetical protein
MPDIKIGETLIHFDAGRDAFFAQRYFCKHTDSKCLHGRHMEQPCDECYAITRDAQKEDDDAAD